MTSTKQQFEHKDEEEFVPYYATDEVERRNERIHDIVDGLQEIHDMHQDLNTMVTEQGVCQYMPCFAIFFSLYGLSHKYSKKQTKKKNRKSWTK